MTICAANGFIYRNSINGADILTQCKTNCLPYDRWTSETFCLLQFSVPIAFEIYVDWAGPHHLLQNLDRT